MSIHFDVWTLLGPANVKPSIDVFTLIFVKSGVIDPTAVMSMVLVCLCCTNLTRGVLSLKCRVPRPMG
jgi:hypothetical protein